jgi:hypothetical protein
LQQVARSQGEWGMKENQPSKKDLHLIFTQKETLRRLEQKNNKQHIKKIEEKINVTSNRSIS